MDFITSISEIFSQYGWWGLIVISGIIAAVYIFKWLLNKQSVTITDNVAKVNENLVNTINRNQEATTVFQEKLLNTNEKILDYFISSGTQNKERHEQGLIRREEISESINDKTKEILIKYHANRVAVLEFHNSSENLNGLPFLRFDLHYENVSRDTSAIQVGFQNISIENLLPIYPDFKEDGYVIYESIDDIYDKSTSLFSMLNDGGARAVGYFALHNSYNKLIGLLYIEYHTQIPENIINIGELKEYASSIATLLEVSQED